MLPKKISTQEQKINSPSVEGDPIDVDTQTVNSPVQQIIDGKKIIYLFYPSATNMNWKISLMLAYTSVESLEPIQPDIIGASSAVPSPQIEPALSYSFNFEEYVDEDEISSSAISSKEVLSEETKNRLKDMLPMLKKDIANLV